MVMDATLVGRIWCACECMLLWMLDQCRVVGGGWTGADCCRETVVVGQSDSTILRCEFILWFRFSILLAASLVVSVAVRCLLRWRASGLSWSS